MARKCCWLFRRGRVLKSPSPVPRGVLPPTISPKLAIDESDISPPPSPLAHMTDDLMEGRRLVDNMLRENRFGRRMKEPPQKTPSPQPGERAVVLLDARRSPAELAQRPAARYLAWAWILPIFVLVAWEFANRYPLHWGVSVQARADLARIHNATATLAELATQLHNEQDNDVIFAQSRLHGALSCENVASHGRFVSEELDVLLSQFNNLVADETGLDCVMVPRIVQRLQRAFHACSSVADSIRCRADNATSATKFLDSSVKRIERERTVLQDEQKKRILTRMWPSWTPAGSVLGDRDKLIAKKQSLIQVGQRTHEAAAQLAQEKKRWTNACRKLGEIESDVRSARKDAAHRVCVEHPYLSTMRDWLEHVVMDVLLLDDRGMDRL